MEILNYNQKMAEIFRDKPELATHIPDWMLSDRWIEDYRPMENAAMVEIAGRDSVAAAIKSAGEQGFLDLIPVYAYTGTEYGVWQSVDKAVKRLADRLPDVRVHPLLAVGSPDFWRALNGRYVTELMSKFGFYSPCPGCHLYLHAIRFPLAKMLGDMPVISGERESHSGQVKINQTGDALDVYLELARRFDVRLLFPLRHVEQGSEIERILGIPWKKGEEQLKCVFSGNYRRLDGSVQPSSTAVRRFFEQFAVPVAKEVVQEYIDGKVPDAIAISRRVLDEGKY